MTLEEQLNADLREAMRAGDEPRKLAIRAVKTAVTEAKVAGSEMRELNDEEVLAIIAKQVKQRRESVIEFARAGRQDLVAGEEAEIAALMPYLPAQMSEEEIRARAQEVIAELGVTDARGFGAVMKRMTSELRGRADGQAINRIVRELLG